MSEQSQATVSETPPLPPLMFGAVTTPLPTYSVREVAKIFFARSPHWIRWRERQGHLSYDGVTVGGTTSAGARVYGLADVERMAHALLTHGAIDWQRFQYALAILKIQGYIYSYLSED